MSLLALCIAVNAALVVDAALVAEEPVLVSPIEKVVTLLEDLKTEVTNEGKSEAATYDKFSCWCKDTTKTKSESILSGADNIDTLSATIADKTATKVLKESELDQLKADHEKAQLELKDATVTYEKNKAEYEKKNADLAKAMSSLDNAISIMKTKKTAIDNYALAEVRKTIVRSVAVADAMSLISAPKSQAISSFLQQKVDPQDSSYKYHSAEIVTLLEQLKTQFTGEHTDLNADWTKTDDAFTLMSGTLSTTISTKSSEIDRVKGEIDTLTGDIAGARGDLVSAQSLLKDDQLYLKDMTAQCEAMGKDWDQQSQMRADEITALTEAITILKEKVTPATAVNVRALLQEKDAKLKVAPKVVRIASPHLAHAAAPASKSNALSFVQTRRAQTFLEARRMSVEQRRDRAVAMLHGAGIHLKSPVLSALATQIAADPFKKVKELIEKLIQRLVAESTAEATKKGYCDTEVSKTTKERDYRMADVKQKSVEAGALEVKIDELTQEIDVLNVKIPEMTKALSDNEKLRKTEKETNEQNLKTANEGLVALKEAISVLKTFYKQAAKAAVLLQKELPIAEKMAELNPTQGAYKGKQESSVAIISLLEQIKDDFQRTISKTTAAEALAAADFVKFERTAKSSISGWETKKMLDEQDLEKANEDLVTTMNEMTQNMKLLDAALKTMEILKPTCIDTGMSYAERVAKREEEIAALKKAICILDTEGVETEACPDAAPIPR